jgi:hypothetical protein
MFVSEEEKKKKEKKNLTVLTSILASLSAIVASLPCVAGEPLVTVWGQILIDRLYDLLEHSNTDLRTVAAATLATFSLMCSGGGRHSTHIPRTPHTHPSSPSASASSSYGRPISQKRLSIGGDGDIDPLTLTPGQSPLRYDDTLHSEGKEKNKEKGKESEREEEREKEEKKEEGAWLMEACLSRIRVALSSAFEKKGTSQTFSQPAIHSN